MTDVTQVTSRAVVRSVTVLRGGHVHIDRIEEFLRGDDVVATGGSSVQTIGPEDDVVGIELEPEVLSIVEAVRTPALLAQVAARLLARESEAFAEFRKAAASRVELETIELAESTERQDNLRRTRDAILAAHVELDREHAELAARTEAITASRNELFAHAQTIRTKRTDLASAIDRMVADVPPAPTLPPKRPT